MASAQRTKTKPATTIDIAIGARLRAFRVQRKLSQMAVGEALGVTFQQIQKYEKGVNRVSGSRLVGLCELLNVKPEQLLGNGTGIYHSEPDAVELLRDKGIVTALMELQMLTPHQRRVALQSFVAMLRAMRVPK